MKYIEYIEFILKKVPLVKIMDKLTRKLKSKLFSKNIEINELLNKVNQRAFKVESFVKMEGLLQPFAFLGEPETFSPTKILISDPEEYLKEKRYEEKKFTFIHSEIPVKEISMPNDTPFKIAFLFPKDCDFRFDYSGSPGEYQLETKNNKFLPILLTQKEYDFYIGKHIILYGQVSKLDDKLKNMLVNTKVGILEDCQRGFYSPYNEYIQGIYIQFCGATLLKEEVIKAGSISNCIEFEVMDKKTDKEIFQEVEKLLSGYLKNKYRILSIRDTWVTHVLYPGKVTVKLKGAYIGFYIDLDLVDSQKSEDLQKELVKVVAFFRGTTKLQLKEIFYSKKSHIDVINNNGKWEKFN